MAGTTLTPGDIVTRLLDGVVAVVRGDAAAVDDLTALYATPTMVTHPMAGEGAAPLTSREELREHFAPGPEDRPIPDFRAEGLRVYRTEDPEVVVAEFVYATTNRSAPCVFVTRVRDGQIVESRDYVDHERMAALFRG